MSKKSAKKETPMMQQYWRYREEVPEDALLLFRLGDFYEMFHADAEEGARLLGITLTQRSGYPMAGIPYHAALSYIPKLLAAGKKVAIVDQVETPQPGKLVKRELTRILTPGTTLEEHQLDANKNHYLLALTSDKKGFHASWLDLSTGDFRIASEENPSALMPLFTSLDPREILLPETVSAGWAHREDLRTWHEEFDYFCGTHAVTYQPDYSFEAAAGARSVLDALKVHNLQGFGIDGTHPALASAGAIITYATDTLCSPPQNLRKLSLYRSGESLLLDPATLRNLEVFQSAQHTRQGSLIDSVDATAMAAGARLLERWLAAPRLDLDELKRRQQAVQEFLEEPGLSSRVHESLKTIRDIGRILGRLQNRIRNPRELGGIRDTLDALPAIRETLGEFVGSIVETLRGRVEPFDELRELLDSALNEELPSQISDGGIIKEGYDEERDRLLDLSRNSKQWLADLEARERARTGIEKMKVKYNGAFGYFFEVSKSNLSKVPDDFIRRQTLVNAERFVTEELRNKEREILSADEKSLAREEELFRELVEKILEHADALQDTASALAEIDLFIGWSQIAREWDFCRPELDAESVLEIEAGRHPVVEQMMRRDYEGFSGSQSFVPNDTWLSTGEEQIALITGPNMAGKSTYIRQIALIVLLAQVGCWVPAKRARIGLVDRIFSRVGASDELARGNSTFMVEMNETANILNNATERSLIILDEIGRGTSTYDGLSIAWAVIEHLHGENSKGPRTLFATHYHELTQLETSLSRLRNFHVSVKEWNDEIIFVRQVLPGAADRSYGIQVARLAGLPNTVIDRAKTILEELETEGEARPSILEEEAPPKKKARKASEAKKAVEKKPEPKASEAKEPDPNKEGQLSFF